MEKDRFEESAYVKVKKGKAQERIKKLKDSGLIRKGLKLKKEGDFILIPVKEKYKKAEKKEKFEKMEKAKDLLKELEEKGIKISKHSYDVIGDIAIVEIDEKDRRYEREIGRAISKVSKVRSVYAKESAMLGEYRVRKLRIIYGEDRPETIYKENDCKMKLNVKEVFFSPRLSYERKRIAELVKENERVLVMFAGVGPFALVIARKCKGCRVEGIELNERAVEYFKENIKLNKLENVNAIKGDVKKVVYEKRMEMRYDRVVMPLPKDAEYFLKEAEYCIKKGGIIHFYTFVEREDAFKKAEEKARKYLKKRFRVLFKRKVRDYSKDIIQVVLDIKIER